MSQMGRVEMAIEVTPYWPDYWMIGALPLGVLLELTLGVPEAWPGPVRAIGRLVEMMERGLRGVVLKVGGGPKAESRAGIVLVTVVVGFMASLVWFTTGIFDRLGGPSSLICRTLLIYLGLSLGGLTRETLRISNSADLTAARRKLSRAVGSDPGPVDEAGIQRGCLGHLGESVNQSVIAPLFWFAMAGPGGLWAYQAIEILYKLVGSRAAGNLRFGRASARLEALANFVPGRVTWLSIALSAAILGEDGGAALRIGWRNVRERSRPGSWWGLFSLAGALGVQLVGRSVARPSPVPSQIWGDPIDRTTVRRAIRIVRVAGLHAAFLAWSARIALLGN
jgi:adenosylcobinamide-phosphate synthase